MSDAMSHRGDNPEAPESSAGIDAESLSFEQAVERLEEIIDRIESGEVGLERSLVEFEEGTRLLRRCREILARAEQRVEELAPELEAGGGGEGGGGPGAKPGRVVGGGGGGGGGGAARKRAAPSGEAD